MSGCVYGGDEVGALVFDIGSQTFRAGYAGEDTPKAEFSSAVGVTEDKFTDGTSEPMDIDNDDIGSAKMSSSKVSYSFDTCKIRVPRENKEIKSFLNNCMIDDWDLWEKAMDHAFKDGVRADSSAHPLLMSEPAWNTKACREKLTEIMFETYNVPAFYLAKSPVLSAFANGKSTGVVLDSGATHTSAIPVIEGYAIQKAIVRSPIGGDFVVQEIKKYLEQIKVDTVPSYMIASKEVVASNAKAIWTKRLNIPETTKSYKNFMLRDIFLDFSQNVLQISDSPYDKDDMEQVPSVHYEFPNGFNTDFGYDRFKIGETLFDSSQIKDIREASSMLGMAPIITTSIGMCDSDVKLNLYGSIIVVGGNTLMNGFTERLTKDLQAKLANNMKMKIVQSNNSNERRYSSWIGGSILASLGSFHQMWISKQEYSDCGSGMVEKKCA